MTQFIILLHSSWVLAYEVLHIRFKPNHRMRRVAVLSFYKDARLLDSRLFYKTSLARVTTGA
jgi:hypothetical protein